MEMKERLSRSKKEKELLTFRVGKKLVKAETYEQAHKKEGKQIKLETSSISERDFSPRSYTMTHGIRSMNGYGGGHVSYKG